MKAKSRSKLVKEADKAWSIYIRTKDADSEGFVSCFTCSKRDHWKNMDCGHFQSRRHRSTRWLELNTAPQCKMCNVFRHGEQFLFGQHLDALHGPGTADSLILKARQTVKLSTADLEKIIERYKI